MNIARLEANDPGQVFYNLRDKLWNHVMMRSEDAFKEADKKRDAIKDKKELSEYCEKKRSFFIESLGGIPYDNNFPLNAQITGVIEEPGLKIEKIIFESRPNVYMTANLYIPEKRKKPCGAVLFQVGHADEGKACAQYQRVARTIASAGLIVMITEPVGQGERLSYFEPQIGRSVGGTTIGDHQYTGEQCVLIGDNIARYFIADAMRAVDYLVSRPEVDSEKIGATGSSGGGTATCYMMLCDPRIKAAAPGTFVTNRREYLYSGNAQDSEQIWMGASAEGFDHHEAIMCFAPKPLLILTVDSDFFPIEGTNDVIEKTKRFWAMHDAEDKFLTESDNSLHKYTDKLAKKAAEFFARELNVEERQAEEYMIKSIEINALNCTKSGQIRSEFQDSRFYFEENLERYHSLKKPKKTLNEFLLQKIEAFRNECPLRLRTMTPIYSEGLKINPYMWFSQPQMPSFGLMFSDMTKKPDETVICLWDKGTDSLEEHIYKIREICKEGKQALVLDLSGVGKCAPNPLNHWYNERAQYGAVDRLAKDLFFLGDSLCALRLFELRYAIKMLRDEFKTEVSIYAECVSAHYARLYGVLEPDIEITLNNPAPDYREIVETRYYESYNISGALLPEVAKYLD